ncbi:hypothetical protein QYF61_026177 [Mycteria americana]|uniref:Uncharacterized protein n=1 Tax=Mycteria americana TaxID=33587 RepID=A0AAN7MS63_MYCAM|nr:hypothetical protein QYF61_026177 [Mycteria americana]
MDGGAGPMRGPHAHGAMAARPMASGAEASAAQHVRVSGHENTGKARKTRSRSARGGAERPSSPRRRKRRREKGCAEPRPVPRRWRPEGAAGQPLPGRPGGEAGQGGAERAGSARRGWPPCHLPPRSPFPPQGRGGGGAPGLWHLREAGLPPPAPGGPPSGGSARARPLSEAAGTSRSPRYQKDNINCTAFVKRSICIGKDVPDQDLLAVFVSSSVTVTRTRRSVRTEK